MAQSDLGEEQKNRQASVRIPENSFLYERVVPALLILMAVVTTVIVLVAVGVLLGIVSYQ